MNKSVLIPKLAIGGIKKNGSCYMPYLLITIFAVFTFFVFSAICDNPIMMTLPKAVYVLMLVQIGRVLLGIILAPVLVSTNQYVMKQRKNELGLYNVLGLDRKYIGVMMFIDSLIIYGITMAGGVILGIIFSRLIFLLLLNVSGLPVQAEFTISGGSIGITLSFFGVLAVFNLIVSLWQVFKAKPIELMKENKKGEKQVKWLKIKSLLGFIILGAGYYTALHTEINGFIFSNFFMEVFLVVLGTRLLFSSCSISILNKLKKTKRIYYQKEHFVTISGMLYRMKRNAQSLSNICIFSTMIIITLICTVSVATGKDEAVRFNYPLDATFTFVEKSFEPKKGFDEQLDDACQKSGVAYTNKHSIVFEKLSAMKEDNVFRKKNETDKEWGYTLKIISLSDYNASEGQQKTLEDNEILVFASSEAVKGQELTIGKEVFNVKEELKHFSFAKKAKSKLGKTEYYIVVKDEGIIQTLTKEMANGEEKGPVYMAGCDLKGTKAQRKQFASLMTAWAKTQDDFDGYDYFDEWQEESESMMGGLVFLGIFFGIVFTVCMVLMMYYKQLSEGYEDQRNFRIFKQVGMSDKEIRGTIKKQILLVFFLPLAMAVLHTFMGLYVVRNLLAVLNLFNTQLIMLCSLSIILIFACVYGVTYMMTSRAYYRIVK